MTTPIYYQPVGSELDVGKAAFECNLALLLKGPTGSGKSRFVERLAEDLGLELITVSCHEETSASDLMGRHLVIGQETKWVDGPLTRSVRKGCMVYLDEVAEARPDTLVLLHALTDHRRQLYLDRTNETLTAPASFQLVASFNPGYQHRLKELKASTRQRFVTLAFDYPQPELEAEIVGKEAQLEKPLAEKLVKLATKLRNLKELGLKEVPSTRLLIHAGRLINSGVPSRQAAHVAVGQALADDQQSIEAIEDLIALYL